MPQIKLKTFDPRTIKDDRVLLAIACRGSGKSTLIHDIMYHKRHLPMGVVMSPTEEGNHFYQNMVPNSFIYDDFYPEALERVMGRQRKKVNEYSDPRGRYVDGDLRFRHRPNAFVIAEDCMADKKVWKTKLVRDLFLNGRHRKAFLLITMQYVMDLSVELRSNVDYVFALMEDSVANKERLYKNFFSMFPTFDMFCQVMDQCTNDYGCIVLDKTIKSSRIEDKVFYYKAQRRPPFRVGCWQYWEYDRLRNIATAPLDEDEEREVAPEDNALDAVQKARSNNKPRITVIKEEQPADNADRTGAYAGNTGYGTDPYSTGGYGAGVYGAGRYGADAYGDEAYGADAYGSYSGSEAYGAEAYGSYGGSDAYGAEPYDSYGAYGAAEYGYG